MRGRPKGTGGTLHEEGTPALVIDVLSTEARWLPSPVLIDLVQEADPSRTRNTVAKAIQRLREAGRIRSRPVYMPEFGHRFEYFSDEWSPGAS